MHTADSSAPYFHEKKAKLFTNVEVSICENVSARWVQYLMMKQDDS